MGSHVAVVLIYEFEMAGQADHMPHRTLCIKKKMHHGENIDLQLKLKRLQGKNSGNDAKHDSSVCSWKCCADGQIHYKIYEQGYLARYTFPQITEALNLYWNLGSKREIGDSMKDGE